MAAEEALDRAPFYDPNLYCEEHRPFVELLNLAEDGVQVDPSARNNAEELCLEAITECAECIALHDAAHPIDPEVLKTMSERAWETARERIHTRIAKGVVQDIFPNGVPEELTEEDMLCALKEYAQSLKLRVDLAFAGEDDVGQPMWPQKK